MDEPDLNPSVAAEGRDLCLLLLEPDAATYPRAVDVFNHFGRALPEDAPGKVYAVWGALTDAWELEPEKRVEVEKLMRDAAREFVSISDDGSELGGYLTRWYQRLRIPE